MVGMGPSNAIGFFIMLAAAATLHSHGVHAIDPAARTAEALRPVGGAFASSLFAIGIVGAVLLGIPVLTGSAGYAWAECFA